jgi:hypothetical protein
MRCRTGPCWRGFSHGVGGNKRSGENGPTHHWKRYTDGSNVCQCNLRRPCTHYVGAVGPDFILMDDNARAHRAHITNRYLEDQL